jgi:hypothetical protein
MTAADGQCYGGYDVNLDKDGKCTIGQSNVDGAGRTLRGTYTIDGEKVSLHFTEVRTYDAHCHEDDTDPCDKHEEATFDGTTFRYVNDGTELAMVARK